MVNMCVEVFVVGGFSCSCLNSLIPGVFPLTSLLGFCTCMYIVKLLHILISPFSVVVLRSISGGLIVPFIDYFYFIQAGTCLFPLCHFDLTHAFGLVQVLWVRNCLEHCFSGVWFLPWTCFSYLEQICSIIQPSYLCVLTFPWVLMPDCEIVLLANHMLCGFIDLSGFVCVFFWHSLSCFILRDCVTFLALLFWAFWFLRLFEFCLVFTLWLQYSEMVVDAFAWTVCLCVSVLLISGMFYLYHSIQFPFGWVSLPFGLAFFGGMTYLTLIHGDMLSLSLWRLGCLFDCPYSVWNPFPFHLPLLVGLVGRFPVVGLCYIGWWSYLILVSFLSDASLTCMAWPCMLCFHWVSVGMLAYVDYSYSTFRLLPYVFPSLPGGFTSLMGLGFSCELEWSSGWSGHHWPMLKSFRLMISCAFRCGWVA